MTFTIPTGHKFAIISLNNVNYMSNSLGQIYDLEENFKITFSAPISFDDWWKKQVGEIKTDQFETGNLFLVAHRHSENIGVLDIENEKLFKKCNSLLSSLIITGPISFHGGMGLKGSIRDEHFDVRHAVDFSAVRGCGEYSIKLTSDLLDRSFRVAGGLDSIQILNDTFLRLKRGINCLLRAGTQEYLADRVHQYVRAIEAVVNEDDSAKFSHRAKEFFSGDVEQLKQVRAFFREVYKIRSCVEHFGKLEDSEENRKKALMLMLLTSKIFTKILSDEKVLNLFLNERSLARFWSQPEEEKKQALGPLFDWDSMQAELSSLTTEY